MQELKSVFLSVPEIVKIVGSEEANQVLQINDEDDDEKVKSVLRSVFTRLMLANKDEIFESTSKMKNRLQMESQVSI